MEGFDVRFRQRSVRRFLRHVFACAAVRVGRNVERIHVVEIVGFVGFIVIQIFDESHARHPWIETPAFVR